MGWGGREGQDSTWPVPEGQQSSFLLAAAGCLPAQVRGLTSLTGSYPGLRVLTTSNGVLTSPEELSWSEGLS